MKYDRVDFLYVLSVVAAFALLFFSNETETPAGIRLDLGIGKFFYFPCALSLFFSIIKWRTLDSLDKSMILLLFLSLFSSLMNPPESSISILRWSLTRFCFGLVCFWNIKNVDSLLFIRVLSIASPFIIIPHYILTNPFSYGLYRYSGFYGDPNYLAMALNFIIAISYLNWKSTHNVLLKLISLISIIASIPLIVVGISRGGLIGLAFVLLFIFIDLVKYHKKFLFITILAVVLLGGTIAVRFAPQIENVVTRFDPNSESDANSSRTRLYQIQSVYNVFKAHPIYIPFGVGLGNNMKAKTMFPEEYFDQYQVHNTFVKMLFEQGFFAFFLFIILMIKQFNRLWHNSNRIYLGIYLASLAASMTLGCITFMPFWIIFYFLWNYNLR